MGRSSRRGHPFPKARSSPWILRCPIHRTNTFKPQLRSSGLARRLSAMSFCPAWASSLRIFPGNPARDSRISWKRFIKSGSPPRNPTPLIRRANESVLSPAALQVRPALDGSWIGALRRRLSRAAVCPDSLRWSACVLKAVPSWALVDHAREVNSPTRSSGPAVSASGCGGERPDGKSDVGQWNRVGVERPITPLRVATGFAVRWVCFAR